MDAIKSASNGKVDTITAAYTLGFLEGQKFKKNNLTARPKPLLNTPAYVVFATPTQSFLSNEHTQ